MRLQRFLAALGCAVAVFALGACGNSADDKVATTSDEASGTPSPSASPSEPAGPLPKCASVWVKGKNLPKHYEGCKRADKFIDTHHIGCSSGQRIVIYDHRFWAVRGHIISEAPGGLRDDKTFNDIMATCRG